ncbi:MAG TPA: M13 family metallopeptidase N-terminal domain-containing protein, partial [Candidatus Angelobacter sp.]|nr:M13 family metallopeptidase N-terminal domain-containing protein [Candidatus Angelobacter sp.]
MRHPFKTFALASCVLSLLLLTSTYAQKHSPQPQSHGIIIANMDTSVVPGDDFYLYANGAWIQRTPIPPDRSRIGVFSKLADLTEKQTKGIIETISKSKSAEGSETRQIADLYASFMDEKGIESRGFAPLKPHLEAIAAIKNKQELARALGESLRADVDPLNNTNFHTANLFGLWTAPGFEDSDHYAAYLLQGGVELPSRDYYLSDTPRMKDVRAKYHDHVVAMLKLAGFTDPEARAGRIVDLEHSIAEKQQSLADNEDIHKANNTWKQSDFAAKAPGLDWKQFFAGAGLDKQEQFTVWQPAAFTGEAALVESAPLEAWKDWLAYHLIEDYSDFLPKAVADEEFNFFDKILTGTPSQRPRWQRGIGLVNRFLGDALGKIYAKKYFPPKAKEEADAMVANLIASFRKRIEALPWMAPATKAEAQKKLDTLYVGIGYPESWHDYSGYEVKAD